MQSVSQAYATSMKSPLRNRGYIQVSCGLYSDTAQADASVGSGTSGQTFYSKTDIFSYADRSKVYGTLEADFCKVDGSMYFLPRSGSGVTRYNNGFVSSGLVSSSNITVVITLSSAMTWYGLTIDFGPNYPVDFDIVAGGNTTQIRGNATSSFRLNQTFTDVSSLFIVFRTMSHAQNRARIYYIRFGVGLNYTNRNVLGSELSRRVSPISEFVPQYDFTLRVLNIDQYLNVDNPNSPINFLNSDTRLTVRYGYELDNGTIEWLPTQALYCSSWEADNFSATIRAQDVLRNLNAEYYKGKYVDAGKSLAALALDVFASAGITSYSIDTSLYSIYTCLPLPRVSHKEALQLIANAGRCVLNFTREGGVSIKPLGSTAESFTMEHMDMTSYPVARKLESVKSLTVQYQTWFKSEDIVEEQIYSESLTVETDEERIFLFNDPMFSYRITISPTPSASGGGIVDSGTYFIKVQFPNSGTYTLNIYAKRFKIVDREYTLNVSGKGNPVVWKNPIVNDILVAYPLATWLRTYYLSEMEYEYDTRGNPELDVTDLIGQENDYVQNMTVRLTDYTFRFNQAFSGHVVARREGV